MLADCVAPNFIHRKILESKWIFRNPFYGNDLGELISLFANGIAFHLVHCLQTANEKNI